jgi:hypothetical protein
MQGSAARTPFESRISTGQIQMARSNKRNCGLRISYQSFFPSFIFISEGCLLNSLLFRVCCAGQVHNQARANGLT